MTEIIVPHSLLLRGLSYQERPDGWVWQGVSGARTIADPHHGLPYGRDRLLFIELATRARESGQVVRCKLGDIKERYELAGDDDQVAEQLIEAAHRVGYSGYEAPETDTCCAYECSVLRRRVAVAEHVSHCTRSGSLVVILSDHFVHEARNGAPASAEVVARLARNRQMGALDMYLAAAWELHTGPRDRVPLFENGHLLGLLSVARTSRRALQQARDRWFAVLAADPGMPFRLAQEEDGVFLVHEPRAESQPGVETAPSDTASIEAASSDASSDTEATDTEERAGHEEEPEPRQVHTWTDDELRKLRKAKGQLTELPWQRRPAGSKTTDSPPTRSRQKDKSEDDDS